MTLIRARQGAAALAAVLVIVWQGRVATHDIPVDVTVHALVKPEDARLRTIVRVPLASMRDVPFPTRGPGYLDLARADAALREAALQWIAGDVWFFEDDRQLAGPALAAVRVSLPSDRSLASWDAALVSVTGPPLPADTQIVWDQAMLDVLLETPVRSQASRFSARFGFARLGLRVSTVLRFVMPDGTVRAFEYSGDPGLVRLDPRWHQAALRFVQLGFVHILEGPDHLLFLLCLVVPLRRLRDLVLIVTSFTAAHSITLIGSVYDLRPTGLWFPPLVETLIAISIVYMALENIVRALQASGDTGIGAAPPVRQRCVMAFAFGLVHGFGFSFALTETLQFAGSHLIASLLSFNLGVELGQILVVAALVPALQLLFRRVVQERIGIVVVSAIVAHSGWHWMIERGGQLAQFDWTVPGPLALAMMLRWTMLAVVVGGVVWLLRRRGADRARRLGTAPDVDLTGDSTPQRSS